MTGIEIRPAYHLCVSCRLALLKALTPYAGGFVRHTTRPSYPTLLGRHLPSSHSFGTFVPWRSELVEQRQLGTVSADHDADVVRAEHESQTSTTSTPWYLRIDTTQRLTNSLLERHKIPKLPLGTPPLLQPILDYISLELGLDDLMIFDLRNIDPPPALGANLLMVLGTARSEKHLHVSADRFCKWLKREHRLSPHADGLLGRGELKLKLRRKARRARLLNSVGSVEVRDTDDGIRTGWICVDVGAIDNGRGTTKHSPGPEGYVGFGGDTQGATVVVQMFTQEKREELDLEGLWSKIQQRQKRKDEDMGRGKNELLLRQEVGRKPLLEERSISDFSFSSLQRHSQKPTMSRNQFRRFHGHSNVPAEDKAFMGNSNCKAQNQTILEPIKQVIEVASNISKSRAVTSHLRDTQCDNNHAHYGDTSILEALRALVNRLESLPSQCAIEALGRHAYDCTSTPFLLSFYRSYPLFPGKDHWECRLAIVRHGIKIDHPGYSKKHLYSLASEMQSSLVEIPARTFSLIFRGLLIPNPRRTGNHEGRPSIGPLTLSHAIDALETMSFRGHRILTEDVYLDLIVGALRMNSYGGDLSDQGPRRLKDLLDHVSGKPLDLNTELLILHECADQKKWSILEDFWRGFARAMQPRPKELYQALFKRVVQRNHQAYVGRILRERIPDMDREEPPVHIDKELAEVIIDCLQVAEPNVESMAAQEANDDHEWARLWRYCQQKLQEGPL